MKNLTVYMPLSWPSLSSKAFRSFVDLISPENIDELRHQYGVEPKLMISDTFPLDRNRNQAVEKALGNAYEADYVFFADADQVFQPRTIQRLLDKVSDDFPVVTGIYFRKTPPHNCVVGHYTGWTTENQARRTSLQEQGFVAPDGSQCLWYKFLQDFTTVQPVDVAGMGCLLVRSDVLKRLEQPIFKYVNCYSTGGDYSFENTSEEMWFFAQLKKLGIKTLCDPSIRAGHITEKVIGSAEEA